MTLSDSRTTTVGYSDHLSVGCARFKRGTLLPNRYPERIFRSHYYSEKILISREEIPADGADDVIADDDGFLFEKLVNRVGLPRGGGHVGEAPTERIILPDCRVVDAHG